MGSFKRCQRNFPDKSRERWTPKRVIKDLRRKFKKNEKAKVWKTAPKKSQRQEMIFCEKNVLIKAIKKAGIANPGRRIKIPERITKLICFEEVQISCQRSLK